MAWRRVLLAVFCAFALRAAPVVAQPIVYTVVNPPSVVETSGFYRLALPARLYSVDLARAAFTSITLQGTTCFAAAHRDGSRIYTACTGGSAGNVLSAIDPATLNVVSTLTLSVAPRGLRLSADGTKLVVVSSTTSAVVTVVSTSPLAVAGTVSVPNFSPSGPLVITTDGARAYVPGSGPPSLPDSVAVIDLAALTVLRQLAVPVALPAGIAISADGGTVAVTTTGGSGGLSLIDTTTDAISSVIDLKSSSSGGVPQLAPDLGLDVAAGRAYVPFLSTFSGPSEPGGVRVVDLAARKVVSTLATGPVSRITLLSGNRAVIGAIGSATSTLTIINLADGAPSGSTVALSGSITQVDPAPAGATLLPSTESCTYAVGRLFRSIMASLEPNPQDPRGSTIRLGITAAPDRCAWTAQSDASWLTLDKASGTGSAIVALTIAANNSGAVRTGHIAVNGQTFTVTQVACVDPIVVIDSPRSNTIITQPFRLQGWAIDRCAASGTGLIVGFTTPFLNGSLNYGSPRPDVAAIYGPQFLNSGFNTDIFPEQAPGTRDLNINFFSPSIALFAAGTGTATNVTILPSAAPFGVLEQPSNSAAVAGEMPVTGWGLDDVKVGNILVYRNAMPGETPSPNSAGRVLIGAATRVTGARPDVQAAFPTVPENDKAGFGLMVLTNVLPNGGNGTFVISVDVGDNLFHVTTLGPKMVTANNSASVSPFGTIDTPAQGATVSGTVVNFGWALAQQPFVIPTDGSTIDVVIDGAVAGHPVYNNFRSDIASLFPSYANSGGAVGYYTLDTRTLANGVHTIAWVIRDSAGHATGVGSRYFTVANP